MLELTGESVRALLVDVGSELHRLGLMADVFLVGGAAIAVAYDRRRLTRDVDAVFAPTAAVRAAVRRVGDRHGLAPDWLNDAVKGFLPPGRPVGRRLLEAPGIRVDVAEPVYLLALKLRAARAEDVDDVLLLAGLSGVSTSEQALHLLERSFPAALLTPRLRFFAEEVFHAAGP